MEKLLSSTFFSPAFFKNSRHKARAAWAHKVQSHTSGHRDPPRHHPCRPCMGGWVPYLGPWEIHKVFPFLLGLEADLGVRERQGHV